MVKLVVGGTIGQPAVESPIRNKLLIVVLLNGVCRFVPANALHKNSTPSGIACFNMVITLATGQLTNTPCRNEQVSQGCVSMDPVRSVGCDEGPRQLRSVRTARRRLANLLRGLLLLVPEQPCFCIYYLNSSSSQACCAGIALSVVDRCRKEGREWPIVRYNTTGSLLPNVWTTAVKKRD